MFFAGHKCHFVGFAMLWLTMLGPVSFDISENTFEPPHDKTNKMTVLLSLI